MLNEYQVSRVWEGMLAAEARSLYFADLAANYTLRKQWITGVSFFLSSGAAATLIGKTPALVPILLAVVVAVVNAYSIAVNLDRKIGTMVKLYSTWDNIRTQYERLWNHAYDEDAEAQLDAITQQEREPSGLAATEAPNNQELLGKWQDHVLTMYHIAEQHG